MQVEVNVGGQRFVTMRDTLCSNGPNYFSSKLEHGWKQGETWFIDRSPELFVHVLNFQRGYTLYLTHPELSMVIQDAKFYGIQPLVDFCLAQLGQAPEDLLQELENRLVECQKKAEISGKAIPKKALDKIEEARASQDKDLCNQALLHLRAWESMGTWRSMFVLGSSALEYLTRFYPEWDAQQLSAEFIRLLDDPEIQDHLFEYALYNLTAPKGSPIWGLLLALGMRLIMAAMMPRPDPTPAPQLGNLQQILANFQPPAQ